MRRAQSLLAIGSLLLATGAAQAAPANKHPDALARITAGRTAGAPVDCLQQRSIAHTTIIDRTAIVYEMDNGRIYVNRPQAGASGLAHDQIMVTDTHTPQICSVDVVRLYDGSLSMPAGSVFLGKFVPYAKMTG